MEKNPGVELLRRVCVAVALIGVAGGAGPVWGETAVLLTTEYPPFSVQAAPDGGAFVAALRLALRGTDWQLDVRNVPWARVPLELAHGGIDGVLICWPKDISQLRLMPSQALFESRLGFFVRKIEGPVIDVTLEAVRGRTVGTVRGYAYPDTLDAAGVVRAEVTSDLLNLKKLAIGRVDLAVLERATGDYLLATPEMAALRQRVVWKEPAFALLPLHLGVVPGRPGAERLLADVNRGLDQLRRDGTLGDLARKYRVDLPIRREP